MPNTRRQSDATLVRRSQQGDRRAFGALVGRYDWRLRGLAHALLLEPGAMDGALSVAYLRAWRDIVRISAKDDVGAWLYRITYNACIDGLRAGGTGGVSPRPDPAAFGPGARGLRGALASLAPSDRVAVVLVDREQFAPEAAARILGLTPAVLADRLAVARQVLVPYLPPPPPPSADPDPGPPAEGPADPPAADSTEAAEVAEPVEPDQPDEQADQAVKELVPVEPVGSVEAMAPAEPVEAMAPAEPEAPAPADDTAEAPIPADPEPADASAEPDGDGDRGADGDGDGESDTTGPPATVGTGAGPGNGNGKSAPGWSKGNRARRGRHTAGRPRRSP